MSRFLDIGKTVFEWAVAAWDAIDPTVRLLLGSVAVFWSAYRGMLSLALWRRRRSKLQIFRKSSGGAGLVRLRPDAKVPLIRPPNESWIDRLEWGATWLKARMLRRQVESRQLTRSDDDAELLFTESLMRAGQARGLQYVPPEFRPHVHLHIAAEYLERADAPEDARTEVRQRIEGLGTNTLVTALFSKTVLEAVDASPVGGPYESYFAKFFQPLMVAFHESAFRRSAGDEIDGKRFLVEHLKMLHGRRIVAARQDDAQAPIRGEDVLERLPRPMPKGHVPGRKAETKRFNRKRAATAILLVASPELEAQQHLTSRKIEERLRLARAQYLELTSAEGEGWPIICTVWHAQEST